jgi:hypothetical protein
MHLTLLQVALDGLNDLSILVHCHSYVIFEDYNPKLL